MMWLLTWFKQTLEIKSEDKDEEGLTTLDVNQKDNNEEGDEKEVKVQQLDTPNNESGDQPPEEENKESKHLPSELQGLEHEPAEVSGTGLGCFLGR